jgi:uncharacterized membrane protein YphA (DoxX/SURF4 family)
MNIALWVLQGFLAFAFFMAGSMKAFSYEKFKKQAGPDAPSKGLASFIGLSEVAGAVGLLLPWATGVLPVLTPVAAAALALVMILGLGFHLQHKHPVGKFIPALVLLVLSSLVAMGRF